MFDAFLQAFVLLFLIMNPFSTLPVFISLTKKFNEVKKKRSANKAILVAGTLALIFILFGTSILSLMNITLSSFRIAGGIVLFLLGLEIVLSFSFSKEKAKDYNVAAVIIATPLITGPGVITTAIVLANSIGILIPSLAAIASLAIIWIIMHEASRIQKFFGDQMIEVFSKIMGLLLTAIAIQFILTGLGIVT